ncbi:MAG: aminomethyl-transferring glycine dehydrogenase [Actinomycetota bacterium]
MSTASNFADRHIGPRGAEAEEMVAALGYGSLDELIATAVPDSIRDDHVPDLPEAATEREVAAELVALADANVVRRPMIGLGYHDTITPPVIRRNLLESPAWYTAYTPYQPEISQGRLEALLNFQTMVADLSGLPLANASLLDEGTAAAEAMTMARRASKATTETFLVDADCHPQTIDVVRTRAEPLGLKVRVADLATDPDLDAFGVLIQYPGSSGEVRDPSPTIERVHAAGGLAVVAADPLALTLLTPPGELGADIVVGSTQRFGVPLFYGGPHAGYIATSEQHRRTLPGRLVGLSVDAAERPALRLALQTREQHIRREKATSNICTAQVLLAVTAGMYAVWHGPEGLTAIARHAHHAASRLAAALRATGVDVRNEHFFDTITARVADGADAVVEAARAAGVELRRVDADHVGIACDETTTDDDLRAVLGAFGGGDLPAAADEALPTALARTSAFLEHPVFHRHRSETEMLRYLRKLSDRDVALDRAMIPLGSCTMKLNATTEMEPISLPGFAGMHPFAPIDAAAGYQRLIGDLEDWLAAVTGYDAVSLQPNAGSQGELAGLLAIRRYHEDRNDNARRLCLIPESAHGTNAASAIMAGLTVKVVACDDQGNVDLDDLRAKIAAHPDELAAVMITYPSTHGVYEETVAELCATVHDAGGQVYVDGANLNALVGVARPGRFGADVSHLNLHKTFCIPHGGGGPGVGPIGVRAHLAPFLPNHPLVEEAGPATGPGAIAAAPWGSAGILPIPWAYIRLMGAEGLTSATKHAVLAANYVAHRLRGHYDVLYTGREGLVAHECIVDLRPLKEWASVDDVAKRLIDYGFHAPTMSFPVAGTLMIEPTESESKAELDRFCDAMIAIRDEMRRVESGEWPADDNPLANAPHPAEDLLGADWTHPYSRGEAAYPVASLRQDKYWVPVGRIDNAYGDRHLVCSCPPIVDLAED